MDNNIGRIHLRKDGTQFRVVDKINNIYLLQKITHDINQVGDSLVLYRDQMNLVLISPSIGSGD